MNKSCVLVIEDEQSIADTIVYALESEGFHVTWKSTGSDGLVELQKNSYDLVVLDVGLPDDSGFEICKKIRSTMDTPIIFLTARNQEIDKIVGLEIGADDYMTKPFSPRELSARVKVILKRTQRKKVADVPKSSSQLEMDESKLSCIYFGESPEFTRYEFRLLYLLNSRPGQVYTRDTLMQKVWDDAGSSLDRTVDAHVKSIRSKLKKINPSIDPIVTHRGVGYSLKERF